MSAYNGPPYPANSLLYKMDRMIEELEALAADFTPYIKVIYHQLFSLLIHLSIGDAVVTNLSSWNSHSVNQASILREGFILERKSMNDLISRFVKSLGRCG